MTMKKRNIIPEFECENLETQVSSLVFFKTDCRLKVCVLQEVLQFPEFIKSYGAPYGLCFGWLNDLPNVFLDIVVVAGETMDLIEVRRRSSVAISQKIFGIQ